MKQLAKPLMIAILTYAILSLMDAFLALPLREISSWFAWLFLKGAGYPATLEGTTLSTSNVRFDVIPACNGSTTLRIMLLCGIIWTGIQKKLNPARKIGCCLSIIPLALVINGLRLFLLVAMSHFLSRPVGDILHSLTGVAAFILGMLIIIGATASLEQDDAIQHKGSISIMLTTCFLAAFFTYLPFFIWTFEAWESSPLDRFGFFYILVAAVLLFISLKKKPHRPGKPKYFAGMLVISLLALGVSTIGDINILMAVSFLSFCTAAIYFFTGWRMALLTLPLILLTFIGIPVSAFLINKVLLLIISQANINMTFTVQLILATILIIAWALIFYKAKDNQDSNEVALPANHIPALTIALLVFMGIKLSLQTSGAFGIQGSDLKLSYILGDWRGSKIDAPETFKGSKTWLRIYRNNDTEIEVIINSSGGNRHNLHPPENCLTGSGWIISSRRNVEVAFHNKKTVEVGQMSLKKGEFSRIFLHWYTDGEEIFPDYISLLAEDTRRRLQGKITNWYLFRIMAPKKVTLTDDFLKHFKGQVLQDEMVDF